MPKLQTVTVRTASRLPIGKGFQECGVSLSYVVDETATDAETVVSNLSHDLISAFQSLWKRIDAAPDEPPQ